MPESLLTILKFCFLALLYLFFLRVVRAVWTEVSPQPAAAPPRARAPMARPPAARGRAAAAGPVRLHVVEPPETRGQSYEVGDEITIGRGQSCQITIDDTFVSQLHARVYHRDGRVYVEDLGSTNGTYLNRKKLTGSVALAEGDRIQMGKTVLEVVR